MNDTSVRPTKKQREILTYIETFIAEHGYSPSYREIMNGLQYTSVATVALHVNSLIRRGHLRKRDRSARSLEVVGSKAAAAIDEQTTSSSGSAWMLQKVDEYYRQAEQSETAEADVLAHLQTLADSLDILEIHDDKYEFAARLSALRGRQAEAG